jgi:protein-tyrosine phosphatase
MKYGKIRIEDGNLIFTRHMMVNHLPCRDILWVYKRQEGVNGGEQKQISTSYLVVVTRRKKRYKFDMTDKEIHDCVQLLSALNPEIVVGFPKGGRIQLQSLPNTRDLGALVTEDGRHILPRRLLRSGSLYHISLTDQDVLTEEYHLTEVIDLRTKKEVLEKPDTLMEGVRYHEIPIVDEETLGISQEGLSRPENIIKLMKNMNIVPEEFIENQYRNFVRDQYSVKQYARFMDLILHHEGGAVLWHCSAGKDRVGMGTAMLLYTLDVDMDTIIEDYMMTAAFLKDEVELILKRLSAAITDPGQIESLRICMGVKENYIKRVFQIMEETSGSIRQFLKDKIGLSESMADTLKALYLE